MHIFGNNKSPLYSIHSSRGPNLIIHQNTLIGIWSGGRLFFSHWLTFAFSPGRGLRLW